ncbi:MAG: DUF5615 family PIN-like protein [Saprospiraceae bacterium]|nr:DUF5615 family PIN-like protein [Saprospiraceae bacterium]
MKFIVDAQLPSRLAHWLQMQGFDAIHTLDLPAKNLTGDVDIIEMSMLEQRVVISKDHDFFNYYLLKGKPHKLLFITAGNIVNRDLIALFELNWPQVHPLLQQFQIIEMNQYQVTVHF